MVGVGIFCYSAQDNTGRNLIEFERSRNEFQMAGVEIIYEDEIRTGTLLETMT